MGIKIGDLPSGATIYHKANTLRVVWNLVRHTVDIYSTAGIVIKHIDNVTTLASIDIDIDIWEYCEFRLIVPMVNEGQPYPPVKKKDKPLYGGIEQVFMIGVDDCYPADRVRPYLPTDIDNPTRVDYRLANLWKEWLIKEEVEYKPIPLNPMGDKKIIIPGWGNEKPNGIGMCKILFDRLYPNDYVYLGVDWYKIVNLIKVVLKHTDTEFTNILLPEFSKNLYPRLMSIQRIGEVNNGRPVYEPWMLWGLYKLLYSKGTEDIPDTPLKHIIFDLSPNWS